MKFTYFQAVLTVVFSLQSSVACVKHADGHHNALRRLHRHHSSLHVSRAERGHGIELRGLESEKRTQNCEFPIDAGLVPVTPNDANGGWAMSPDQCCEPGDYCPYACPPGQVMAQWDPDATTYSYPQSMVCVFLLDIGLKRCLCEFRTEGSTAIKTERLASRSQTNPIASMAPGM